MNRRIVSIVLAFAAGMSTVAVSQKTYIKEVTFPEGASTETKVDMAARLVPSAKQLAWQKLELTAFLHFGINTFTDREWGDGSESPSLFNPARLDAEQWVRTLKNAGFKLVILTAKHHDGFCLWPTKTTAHSVAASPWKDGKGDVVRELREACDKYGMKMGVYLSPWDRNAECYGDSPRYNDMFVAQLTELLSNYGHIDEVWFDGACGEGPNGKKQEYDWTRYKTVIEQLQPDAVVAIMGDDVRWVGNEKGVGRETEWSATALTPGIYPNAGESNAKIGIYGTAKDLGSRDIVAKADKLYWWPSEVDVSIRPGWFFHDKEQPKPLRQLAEIYLSSVGRNSVLLLNIPPDRDGLIAEADCTRLAELRDWIDTNFSDNRVGRFDAATGVAELKECAIVNAVVLGENLAKGQRVERFDVEARVDGVWQVVASGTTIGHKRILHFPEVEADALRLSIGSSRLQPDVNLFEAYRISLPAETNIDLPGYRRMPAADWRVTEATGNREQAYCVFDDDASTFWASASVAGEKTLAIDLGETVSVAGFVYTPRGGDDKAGTIFHYRFLTSIDGRSWTEAPVPGEFSNIVNNPIEQKVYFPTAINARFVKLVAIDEIEGRDYVTVGELSVLVPEGDVALCDNEQAVYRNPSEHLKLQPGDAHPKLKGWNFYTAYEFDGRTGEKGVPQGWVLHDTPHMARSAKIDGGCFEQKNGYLRMKSMAEPEDIDNGHGKPVGFSTFACRSAKPGEDGFWCNFTENMRVEVRFRCSSAVGFNDALWFMGNDKRRWPANGEIDLLENPRKTPNDIAHFTLHSENHYAGVVGGTGSVTSSVTLRDMSDWNIYWMELYPDKIVGGVNGATYFTHHRGDNGNNDWPWSNPEGFFMLVTSGLSVTSDAWPGAVDPSSWDECNPPHADIDWVRVYVNSDYTGEPAPAVKFY